MNESDWKKFLTEFNSELLSYEEVIEALPREVIKAGWVGHSGASESEVATAEGRLGAVLPPSFRAFLKVTNGWRFPSPSISDLLSTSRMVWFREQNQDWIDAYTDPIGELRVPDEEYFVYGAKQDSCKFRAEYLQAALQVSGEWDGAVVLLNPEVLTSDGEWETWFFANWLPGACRYRSFSEWMKDSRAVCKKQFTQLPKAKVKKYVTEKKPVSVKKAQEAARRGETELALESLERFAEKGEDNAAASLAELYAFLGDWEKVITNAGRLIANPGAVYAGNVYDGMMNLLGRAGHRSGRWEEIIAVVEKAREANKKRDYDQHHEYIRENHEKQFQNLIAYAQRKGAPPHELLAIFGHRTIMEEKTEEERRKWYEDAVKNVDSLRPDLKKNPVAKAEHFFSLAQGVWEDEALRLYEERGADFVMAWPSAEYVAGIYARRGDPERAWETILRNLSKWWPVDFSQVAPIVLLTDWNLCELMTPDRCRIVLATVRGPEGTKGR